MRERPILFSGPMVLAILAARKMQTRRLVTALAGVGQITEFDRSDTNGYDWHFRNKRMLWNDVSDARVMSSCPHGCPGDRLWVRESFKPIASGAIKGGKGDIRYGHAYQADNVTIWRQGTTKITDLTGKHESRKPMQFEERPWKPSIHMPRRASRILLEITGLCLQRLQDIREAEILAEGVRIPVDQDGRVLIDISSPFAPVRYLPPGALAEKDLAIPNSLLLRAHFASLWDSLNFERASWDSNPFVWAITFKRIEA